jgi:hypothetical protein
MVLIATKTGTVSVLPVKPVESSLKLKKTNPSALAGYAVPIQFGARV